MSRDHIAMEKYTRQAAIEGWNQQRVMDSRVLVIGAGTIGNEIIKNMALIGFTDVTILDSDTIEEVNLNRSILFRDTDTKKSKAEVAAESAKLINKHTMFQGHLRDVIYDVGSLFFSSFDCALLAVDNLEARLEASRQCHSTGIPVIDTGIHGLDGNIFISAPPDGSCLECCFSQRDQSRIGEKYSCLKIGLPIDQPAIPMVITSAAIIAGIAVQECLKIIGALPDKQSNNAGRFHKFYGASLTLESWSVPRSTQCQGHQAYPESSDILELGVDLTWRVEDIVSKAADALNAKYVEVWHNRDIVYDVVCRDCSYREDIKPAFLGQYIRSNCPMCGNLSLVPNEFTGKLRESFTLESLRIPEDHLLKILHALDDDTPDPGVAWLKV